LFDSIQLQKLGASTVFPTQMLPKLHLVTGPHHDDPAGETAPKHPEPPGFDIQSGDLEEGPALPAGTWQKDPSYASRENMNQVQLADDLAAVAGESAANQGETVRNNQREGEHQGPPKDPDH
jgi:hypothetical protein